MTFTTVQQIRLVISISNKLVSHGSQILFLFIVGRGLKNILKIRQINEKLQKCSDSK